jgi:ketosteroid isomerase-like protein
MISVQDRFDLQELIARYSIARDDRDIETLIGLFAENAIFERAGRTVEGRERIRDFFLASMSRYDLTTHTTHSQVLESVSETVVRGIVTGHAELVLEGKLVVASYRYADEYRRTQQGWRLGRRSLSFLYAMPIEELSTGFKDRYRIRWPNQAPALADYPESLPTWDTAVDSIMDNN